MEPSTIVRNIIVLQELLSGQSYHKCAKKLNISVTAAASSVRSVLKYLKQFTNLNILDTTSHSYLLENKLEIEKALTEPYPKVKLTPTAIEYLPL